MGLVLSHVNLDYGFFAELGDELVEWNGQFEHAVPDQFSLRGNEVDELFEVDLGLLSGFEFFVEEMLELIDGLADVFFIDAEPC